MTVWRFEPGDFDEDAPEDLFRVVRSLRAIAQRVAPEIPIELRDRHRPHEFDGEINAQLGDKSAPFFESIASIHAYVDLLNRVLDVAGSRSSATASPTAQTGPSDRVISTRVFAGRKPIHLGSLERYFVYPASPPLHVELLRFVVAIPDMSDVLIREQHDVFGWHYHYCDQRRRRSDILMSFDRKRNVASANPKSQLPPLCWEPHGVNKAKFKAKPWLWGDRKRKTIYEACAPDLGIVPALTFKPPSREAADVWPTT